MLILFITKGISGQMSYDFCHGVFGIDLWHAVEFSRYDRVCFTCSFELLIQGDFPNLVTFGVPVKSDTLGNSPRLAELHLRGFLFAVLLTSSVALDKDR
jgi:hypothetical protein